MTSRDNLGAPHVAYLVSQYPAPSHVFIEREIQGLRALGAQVTTFSIRPTPPELLLSAVMQEEAAATTVLLASKKEILRSAARTLRSRPGAVASVLRRALSTGEPYVRARLRQLFYLGEALRLFDALSRSGVRHLHVHFSNNGADVARLVVALGRAADGQDAGWRWSMTVHGPTEFEAVDRWDLAAKVRDADGVACISDFTRSQLMRLVPTTVWPHLDVVRMGVDVEAYQPEDRSDRTGPLRVLYVGRLVAEKGAPVLLKALADLSSRGIAFEARLVGSGPLEVDLRARVSELGLIDRVELCGSVGQDSLPSHYRWADAFCLPSFQEGLPVVLMEAQASGLPVVTTAIAGIPELVRDGRNGVVVPAGRADRIADALFGLAVDPDLRHRYGVRARQDVVAVHSIERVSQAQFDFLSGAAFR